MGALNEHRRPIFWFLWPRPDPHAPRDEQAQQIRLVRVTPRGPIRLAFLVALSIVTVGLLATAIMSVAEGGITLGSLVAAALAATAVALTLRGWVVGTYVNDRGIVIETALRRVSLPWTDIVAIPRESGVTPLLGLPLRMRGQQAAIVRSDGTRLTTHVSSLSPDLWGRPEAFDIACIRLDNWLHHR